MCKLALENEVHFVFECPALDDLRTSLIPFKYSDNPCDFYLSSLLASKSDDVMKNLSFFLFKAFKRREMISDCTHSGPNTK